MQLSLDRPQDTDTSQRASAPRTAKAAVTKHQREMKRRFDRKHRVKSTAIKVSDWVRTRRPQRHNKMASFWSQPLQVRRQLGPATFMLSDGSRWHASRLRRVPAPPEQAIQQPATGTRETDTRPLELRPERHQVVPPQPLHMRPPPAQPQLDVPPAQPPPAQFEGPPALQPAGDRPQRERARPAFLKDYVTSFHT